MAKVSNETRLVISLFKERAERQKVNAEIRFKESPAFRDGKIKGLEAADDILAGITNELERR